MYRSREPRNPIKSRRSSNSSEEHTFTPVGVGTPTAGEATRVERAMSARVSFIVLLMSGAFEVIALQNLTECSHLLFSCACLARIHVGGVLTKHCDISRSYALQVLSPFYAERKSIARLIRNLANKATKDALGVA